MNNVEAIEEFKKTNEILRGGDNGSYRIAKTIVRNDLAISALEKQIPQRVRDYSKNRLSWYSECPYCKKQLPYVNWYEKSNYCPDCGQKLNWEEN